MSKMVKVSSKVREAAWEELKQMAEESNANISALLTEAVEDYLRRKRVRPEMHVHIQASIRENETLGQLLAQ